RDKMYMKVEVMEQQTVYINEKSDIDNFGYSYNKGWMCIQEFYVRLGKILERDVSIFPFYTDAEDAFLSFVGQFYLHKRYVKPKQILVPLGTKSEMIQELLKIDVQTPCRGKKKELADLAEKNAKIALEERFSLIEMNEERTIKAVEKLGDSLNIASPRRIEAFDNSNIQGVDPVSAMIVFTDGKADKQEY